MNNRINPRRETAATVEAQKTEPVTARIWRWLTGYSLSPDEVVRMTLLYTEIL